VNAMSIILTEEQQEELSEGIPGCDTSLSTPVVDTARYVDEIHYKIGDRTYVENAE
jgi:hypothetical protein